MRACASLPICLILGSALVACLSLGGCSVSGLIPDWVSDDSAGPEPINYRFTIANAIGGIIGGKDDPKVRVLELTTPHRADGPKGATWMVCMRWLRGPAGTPPAHYAIFIQRDRIVDSRMSIGLDQCETQTYAPFEWSVDVDSPLLVR